jgi:hypothetical protein
MSNVECRESNVERLAGCCAGEHRVVVRGIVPGVRLELEKGRDENASKPG